MKKIFYFCSLILVSVVVACSNDDDFGINDIVGKWECYEQNLILKDVKTGEIISETGTFRGRDGKDSTWIEVFYENGTGREMYRNEKREIWKYEIEDNYLIVNGYKRHIDVLTHEVMKLRHETGAIFDYESETSINHIRLYTYRRIE